MILEAMGTSMSFLTGLDRSSNRRLTGGSHACEIKTENNRRSYNMSQKEMSDNITFIAALEMLAQLEEQGLLTSAEVEKTKTELKHRLRPTLILV